MDNNWGANHLFQVPPSCRFHGIGSKPALDEVVLIAGDGAPEWEESMSDNLYPESFDMREFLREGYREYSSTISQNMKPHFIFTCPSCQLDMSPPPEGIAVYHGCGIVMRRDGNLMGIWQGDF
jgi:hypothetical protein